MNPRVLLPALCTVLTMAAAGPAAAQEDRLTASPDSSLAATLEDLPGERLHLLDAVANASVQATGARIAQAQLSAAEQAVRREKGAFDPGLFGTANWGEDDTPSASLFAGADVLQTSNADFSAGARIQTKLGTEITASMNTLRLASNSAYSALNPEYQSYGRLLLRQPLLNGFGPSARSDLAFAESNEAGAGARYESALLAVRSEVEIVYWQLYAAERNHAVTTIIRDRAAAFLDDARLRAKAGMIGPSQVANAEFFLTEAEQALLDTEEILDRTSDRMASLTGRRPAGQRYRTADEPPKEFPLVPQDALIAEVMKRNPDLQALSRNVDAVSALERGAVWDARPTLDLIGALGGNGLSGAPQDVYFPGDPDPVRTDIDGDRGDAASQALKGDYPTWNVGLVFSVPIGNREGKGERDRYRAEIVRAEQELLSAQRTLEEETRAQYRELERGRRRLELATQGVSASFKQVDYGMILYNNGQTTAFEIVRLAADLATAQQRYSDALVRTARAAAVLRQLTGGWYPGTEEN